MNIEDWLASVSEELMEARTGNQPITDPIKDREWNTWDTVGKRLDMLTKYVRDAKEFAATYDFESLIIEVKNIYDEIIAASGSYVTRKLSVNIGVNNWTETNSSFTYTITDTEKLNFLTSAYQARIDLGNSYFYLRAPLIVNLNTNQITFTTTTKPTGALSVTLYMQPSLEVI